MEEIWKDISEFEGYQVSTLGRVRSMRTDKPLILSPGQKGAGYLCVNLRKDGKSYSRTIHRLVYQTFVGPTDLDVSHVDGDASNNRLDNLYAATHRDNIRDKYAHGTIAYGQDSPVSKLTDEQVLEIISRYTGEWGQQSKLAKEYGIGINTLNYILSGHTWKHLGKRPDLRPRLSLEEAREIRRRKKEHNLKGTELAKIYGVTEGAISRILSYKTHREEEV